MRDLTHRCTDDELMDDPLLSEEKLNATLDDISMINKRLGGNSITVNAIKKVFKEHPAKTKWTIADVGCGDGEMLRILANALVEYGYEIKFIGIDINEKGLHRARRLSNGMESISYLNEDIFNLVSEKSKYDIIISTLTLHHIQEEGIVSFIDAMIRLGAYALIINDLQRSAVAYRLYQLISRIFIKSEVAKYDGLVSIASGFKREDLESYAQQLRLKNHKITWKWAFRYLWYIKTI